MSHWYNRFDPNHTQPASYPTTPLTPIVTSQVKPAPKPDKKRDPNKPDPRYEVNQKCVYERRLPGDGYITAHVSRVQFGYYDHPDVHGDLVDNVRFLAVHFVFHPSRHMNRFISATIKVGLHDDTDQMHSAPIPLPNANVYKDANEKKPKFLQWAPHLLFGSISPETLDWNFNLAGSLGVTQGPASATVSPSGGWKGNYKVYEMMKIQGSVRTLRHWCNRDYDHEDGELVWSLEENRLQKSGLPREFTFAMLLTKGDIENVVLDIEIEPKVATKIGTFPLWFTNLLRYRPIHHDDLDLEKEVGQKFQPITSARGYNFAELGSGFDDYVSLPGTTFSTSDHGLVAAAKVDLGGSDAKPADDGDGKPAAAPTTSPPAPIKFPSSLNVHVVHHHLQHTDGNSSRSPGTNPAEKRNSRTIEISGPPKRHSLRHSNSRTDLRSSVMSRDENRQASSEHGNMI